MKPTHLGLISLLSALVFGAGPAPKLSSKDIETLTAGALAHYLTVKPPAFGEPACVTVPGYKAPNPSLRAALPGLDSDPSCHFRDGRLVYWVSSIRPAGDGSVEVAISRHRFHDVSVFVDGFVYRFERRSGSWTITDEIPHASNTIASER